MGNLRFLLRALLIITHVILGATLALGIVALSRLGRRPTSVATVVRWWHRRLCGILRLRIQVAGQLNPDCLLIANHISWLDIPAIGTQGEIGFLAKTEIRGWPLIGWMAEVAGTHFIERGANRIQEVCATLEGDLAQGRTLMIFPEGTTSDGRRVLRFHPRLFALAQVTGRRIQPVALAYRRGQCSTPDSIAPFIDDDTLVAHLLRIIRHPDLVADIRFLPAIAVGQTEPRRVIAQRCQHAISAALGIQTDLETSRRIGSRGQARSQPPVDVAHAA